MSRANSPCSRRASHSGSPDSDCLTEYSTTSDRGQTHAAKTVAPAAAVVVAGGDHDAAMAAAAAAAAATRERMARRDSEKRKERLRDRGSYVASFIFAFNRFYGWILLL